MKIYNPIILIVVLAISVAGTGCGRLQVENKKNVNTSGETLDISDMTAEAEVWADSVVEVLDDYQRAAQCLMPAVYASADALTLRLIHTYAKDYGVGGVILLKGTQAEARTIAKAIADSSSIAPFVTIDAEWGLGMRLKDAPCYPRNGELGKDTTVSYHWLYDYGREVAAQCRREGINMVLGPVMDVAQPGGSIGSRSYGADLNKVAEYGVAYSRGLEDGGVISVAKHFPGHGSARDSHKGLSHIEKSWDELWKEDLYPFREYIRNGLSGIMVGHLAVDALNEQRPGAVSEIVIDRTLRKLMKFDGLVLTDAISMEGARGYSAADAICAGSDLVLAPVSTKDAIEQIMAARQSGRLSEKRLKDAARKVLFYKYLFIYGRE